MKKLDRFILKSFLGPMAAVFFVVLFILVMQFLWLYIDELVGKGLGLGVILEFLGWGCCTIIPTALPLAVLLASMMTLGNLAENNELLAIKAAGISLGRVLAPMSVVAVLICIGAFFASNNLIPLSYQKIYTLRNDILRTKNEIKIPENTFYDGIDGYVLRIDRRDDESGMMHGVIVYNHSSNKGNVSLTLADSALMDISDNKKYLTFELFDGINYEETNTRKYRDTTLQFQKIRFSHQELRISLENYAFQKSDDSEFRNEVKAMNLERLRYQKDSIGGDNRTLLENHYSGLMQGRQPRYSRQLDTSATGIRCDFEPEGLCTWNSLEKELAAVDRAGNAANELAAPGDSTEAQLIQRTERVLYTWFRRARRAADDRQWAAWVGRKRDKSGGVHFVRPNALRALSHDAPGGSGGLQKQTLFSFLQGRTPEPILRRYVEDCFGASMLTPGQRSEAERTLCTGVHKNCRLHFTRGEPVGRAPAPEAAWDAAHFRQQREKNRAYYREHLVENKLAIAQLTQKLQNTLLLRAEDEGGTGRAGRLRPELAWRAGALGDERVFSRRSPQEPGELSVDLLLDGSASQNRQQEKLATQAYLIAESLSRCRIPVRVTAFCSVSGCTVLRDA